MRNERVVKPLFSLWQRQVNESLERAIELTKFYEADRKQGAGSRTMCV